MNDTALNPQSAPGLVATLPGGLNPVDLWLNLHTAQGTWAQSADKEKRDNIVASNRLMLESLADFPVERWLAFNHAIGWFPAAIAAATWCRDATLAHSVSVWNGLGLMPAPEPGADFAARLIKPALLPELSILAIGTAAAGKYAAGALLIAARDEAPAIDFANAETVIRRDFPRALAEMLALRGAIPAEWVRSAAAPAAAAPSAPPAPQKPRKEEEPYYFNTTIGNMLHQRKIARGWQEAEIAAALAAGAGAEVAGFRYFKAFRFAEPGAARSVVADENGRVLHVGRPDYIYSDTLAQTTPAELPPTDGAGEGPKAPDVIHVPLFGEFIDVWCPVRAERLRGNIFMIADRPRNFRDETWGTNYGPRVECEVRRRGEELMLFFKSDAEGRR